MDVHHGYDWASYPLCAVRTQPVPYLWQGTSMLPTLTGVTPPLVNAGGCCCTTSVMRTLRYLTTFHFPTRRCIHPWMPPYSPDLTWWLGVIRYPGSERQTVGAATTTAIRLGIAATSTRRLRRNCTGVNWDDFRGHISTPTSRRSTQIPPRLLSKL